MKPFSLLLLALFCLTASSIEVLKGPHECHHDKLNIKLETVDTGDDKLGEDRTLITYESIRIILDFSTMSSRASDTEAYIQSQILAPVQNLLASALKVKRLTSRLTAGGAKTICGGAITTPSIYNSGGVAADLVVFVVDTTDSTSNYIAQASACTLSTTDFRPVFGLLKYNLYYVSATTNDATIESHIYTTLHEITHVLGFSSSLYSYYRNLTTNAPLKGHVTTKTVNGASVTALNLAPLTTRIRSHFNCSTIGGAYLENEGRSGSAGSHFERRIFYNDYMTASAIHDSRFSQFTLALLEGTGWYSPDYTYAEPLTWGKNKGCNFLDTPCVNSVTKLSNFEEFCSRLASSGMSWNYRGYGICVGDSLTTSASLPSYKDYWGNKTVNNDAFADNCPIRYPYSNMDCEDPTRKSLLTKYEFSGYGGKGFTGTLYSGGGLASSYGYCFKYNCVAKGKTYTLQVVFGSSHTATCTAAGHINAPTGTGLGGKLYCPDPTKFCTQVLSEGYCKGSCFGRGTCVNKKCVCQDGWTFHDCIKKTYVDNCPRCAGNGNKTSCYGDECVCNPSNSTCVGSASGGLAVPPLEKGTEWKSPEEGPSSDLYPGGDFSFFAVVAVILGAAVIIAGLRAGAKAGSPFVNVPASQKSHIKTQAVSVEESDPEVQLRN